MVWLGSVKTAQNLQIESVTLFAMTVSLEASSRYQHSILAITSNFNN